MTTKKDLLAAQLKDLQTKLDSLNQQIAQVSFPFISQCSHASLYVFPDCGYILFQIILQQAELDDILESKSVISNQDEKTKQYVADVQDKQTTLKLRRDDLMKETYHLENDIVEKERQIKKT